MIRAREVADFLRAADLEEALSDPTVAHAIKIVPDDTTPQGEMIAQPDRLIAVTISGGARTLRERTFDQPRVQLTVRGLQRSDDDAEALAQAVDDVLMGMVPPTMMGDSRVISLDYLGGPPAFVARDDGHRALYACNYLLQVARTVT